MPRTKRFLPPADVALHITARGNNHLYLFRNDTDKSYYLNAAIKLKEENNIEILHYCLMNNHVHMIVWLRQGNKLSRFMKQLQLKYFSYYKATYGYTGHLWQGRFKSNIIDTDVYLLACGKYIELNPVRSQIVSLPEAYRFSSYQYYAYGHYDPLISPSPAYLALSNDPESRRRGYIAFVIGSSIINMRKLQTQLFIGSDTFITKLEKYFRIKNTSLRRGRPKKRGK